LLARAAKVTLDGRGRAAEPLGELVARVLGVRLAHRHDGFMAHWAAAHPRGAVRAGRRLLDLDAELAADELAIGLGRTRDESGDIDLDDGAVEAFDHERAAGALSMRDGPGGVELVPLRGGRRRARGGVVVGGVLLLSA